jgi:hypothetical protein
MSRQDSIRHHGDRALAELELARQAESEEAALAHLELSELHLERMHKLTTEPQPALRIVGS